MLKFMGVIIKGNKYICEHCEETLAGCSKEYLKNNYEVATEDYPSQLAKEHKVNCEVQWAAAYRQADIAIAYGAEGGRDELARELLEVN